MGSRDNKSYIKVRVELAKLYKPSQYNILYNNLTKVAHNTEDKELISLINNYCNLIIDVPSLVFKQMPQLLSDTIDKSQNAKQELDNYCMNVIVSSKPEWQIIAESRGWTPPA
jgi:hypothetical protein